MHMRARRHHVVAFERRNGNGRHQREAELTGEGREILGDRIEARLVEVDEIHLVDGERDPADAEQRQDAGMTAGLGEDAATGIDQEHGEVAIRCARRHVARVLHMAGRIGDDELPPRRRKIAVGDVDGDLLLTLGLQSVDQERKVDRRRPAGARTALAMPGALHLILEHEMRIVEETADQRALAVVHAAAGEKPQEAAILLRRDPGLDPRAGVGLPAAAHDAQARHQK